MLCFGLLGLLFVAAHVAPQTQPAPPTQPGARPPLRAVPFHDVTINDAFWKPRMQVNREKTLPHVWRKCEETGRIANLARAAGRAEGPYEGYFFNDSDVFKLLEGACYLLQAQPDPDLRRRIDELVGIIAAAQQPDGYLNSYFTIAEPDQRWTNLKDKHELYCAGHLIEAAVAHQQATGERTLLDVAIRLADHIAATFGPDRRHDVCGHPEIELALLRLADATSDRRYADLAAFFVNERGRAGGRELYGQYCQDHCPLIEQSEIVGHAVRATYLYTAATLVSARSGDEALLAAVKRIFDDLVRRKMYITGGVGTSAHNEGFTTAFDLPNESAYAETCASIGLIYWCRALNQVERDARYVDVLERALYNAFLSGIALDGEHFFYANPLASRGGQTRPDWYNCACCPPNILRLLASLGGYVYARDDDALYVNLYVAGSAKLTVGGREVVVTQQTRYPWDGGVEISIRAADGQPVELPICVRIPGWCDGAALRLNGAPLELAGLLDRGYARVAHRWRSRDALQIQLPMPALRYQADPRVAADRGRVALQRGPLVYCLEGLDNPADVRRVVLPREAALGTSWNRELLGGIIAIQATGTIAPDQHAPRGLYYPAPAGESVELLAVPYAFWCNRGATPMTVWLPESLALLDRPPRTDVSASASHESGRDGVLALYDRIEPARSDDPGVPRFTWWDHKGTSEWVRYEFDAPRRVQRCAVYWFDDRATGGGCRVPVSWRLLYLEGDSWKPVAGVREYGTARDRFNEVEFAAVTTAGLTLEVTLQPAYSGGILEWRLDED